MPAERTGERNLEHRVGDDQLLPHVAEARRNERPIPRRLVARPVELDHVHPGVGEVDERPYGRASPEVSAVFEAWPVGAGRPFGPETHLRGEGVELAAVGRALSEAPGDEPSRRVVREAGIEEPIPSPIAEGLVAAARRVLRVGRRRVPGASEFDAMSSPCDSAVAMSPCALHRPCRSRPPSKWPRG